MLRFDFSWGWECNLPFLDEAMDEATLIADGSTAINCPIFTCEKKRVKVQCQGFFCKENWGSYLLKLSELCESMNSRQDFQLLFLTLQADKKNSPSFLWHLKNSLAALHMNYEDKIKVSRISKIVTFLHIISICKDRREKK